jgi:hypothetical protein
MEGCSTSAWERLPELVDRQSNPSLDWVNTCTPGGSSSLLGCPVSEM